MTMTLAAEQPVFIEFRPGMRRLIADAIGRAVAGMAHVGFGFAISRSLKSSPAHAGR